MLLWAFINSTHRVHLGVALHTQSFNRSRYEVPRYQRHSMTLLQYRTGVQDVPGVPEASYRCVVRGRQTMRRGQQAADTCVLLAVLRLPHVSSDLLITLSTPSAPQTPVAGAVVSAPALGEGEQQELMAAVLRSLRVQSWELFG